jgi:ribulose-phosphate 3-epimerase
VRHRIAPSVLSFNHADLRAPVAELIQAGADLIHIDVMDGQFVPPITIGDGVVRGLQGLGDALFEAHLMTLTPERHFDAFIQAGCKRIIFHQEVSPHAHRLAQSLRERGVQAGIALNPGTSTADVEGLLDVVDLVLVMTVNPGWGGQEFIGSALRKVERIRSLNSHVEIEVDGGINLETLPVAKAAGANLFVAGSFLTKGPSVGDAYRELAALCG